MFLNTLAKMSKNSLHFLEKKTYICSAPPPSLSGRVGRGGGFKKTTFTKKMLDRPTDRHCGSYASYTSKN